MPRRRNHLTEVLVDNFVTKDFQKVLTPLNMLQQVFFLSKYVIKDNFITSNGHIYNLMSFLAAISYLSLVVMKAIYYILRLPDPKIYLLFILEVIIMATGLITNVIINVKQSENNVRLVLTLQKILRKQMSENIEQEWKIMNLVSVGIILVTYILFYLNFFIAYYQNNPFYEVLVPALILIFDMNMIYAANMAKIIAKQLDLWIIELKLYCTEKDLNDEVETDAEFHCIRLLSIYEEILLAYKIYKTVFKHLVRI